MSETSNQPEAYEHVPWGVFNRFRALVVAITVSVGAMVFGQIALLPYAIATNLDLVPLIEPFATAVSYLAVLGFCYLYLYGSGIGFSYFDFEGSFSSTEAAWGIAGFLSFVGIQAAIDGVATVAGYEVVSTDVSMAPFLLLLMIPTAAVVVAPVEEILFRNVVQKRLSETFSPVSAIVTAGFIFAFLHAPVLQALFIESNPLIQNVLSVSKALLPGLVLGYLYQRHDDVRVPMVAHGLFNFTVYTWGLLIATGLL